MSAEKIFNDLVGQRLKARASNDKKLLEETEERFKEATKNYIKHIYDRNKSNLNMDGMENFEKNILKGINLKLTQK